MHSDIANNNKKQPPVNRAICETHTAAIAPKLPLAESKVWHGGPVWFIDGNPVVGNW